MSHQPIVVGAQEGQHYRQHMLLNDAIGLQGFPKLADLEQELPAMAQEMSAAAR